MIDVCYILEGTYPYVSGGVSSWIHDLILAFPELNFGIVHLSPQKDSYREFKYPLPKNVRDLREVYIFDHGFSSLPRQKSAKARQDCLNKIEELYLGMKKGQMGCLEELQAIFYKNSGLSAHEFLYSQETFALLKKFYEKFSLSVSFLDFFWTNFFLHVPLLRLFTTDLPPARVYHCASTGYAGLLLALAKIRTGQPTLLTEHGIYTREREIEIDQSEWIYEPADFTWSLRKNRSFFRSMWIEFFQLLAKITYQFSDEILTISHRNQFYQLKDGAFRDKMRVISNGVNIEKFAKSTVVKEEGRPFGIAFIGRVVAIKDVKTFIRSIKILTRSNTSFQIFIIGPGEEDPEYHEECLQLAKILGIEDKIIFTGKQKVSDYFPKIDLVVLTSISEGQPLVILEANCVGIPVVATDVGACRELLEGQEEEDRALGPGGIITPIANATETALAIRRLWEDPALYQRMSEAGQKRMQRYYDIKCVHKSYQEIYYSYLGRS